MVHWCVQGEINHRTGRNASTEQDTIVIPQRKIHCGWVAVNLFYHHDQTHMNTQSERHVWFEHSHRLGAGAV